MKNECTCRTIDGIKKQCKRCYDGNRYSKMKSGDWKFNTSMPETLSSEQEQVLIGGLLGDFYIYQNKNHKNAGISCGRSSKDKEYAQYQADMFETFCNNRLEDIFTCDKRTGKTYHRVWFRTRVAEVFTPYRKKWYPDGKKIVPRDLILTPLICAIWFCDDGTVVLNKKKNKVHSMSLATDGFKKEDVEFLFSLLKDTIGNGFVVQQKRYKGKSAFYIRLQKEAMVSFIKYIDPVFPNSMKRKSDRWRRDSAFLQR